jgi:glycosyltransferase involved in cell wall biosynthesis
VRIAIVHENWGAGAARCARDLECELQTRGHDVLFFPRSESAETPESLMDGLASFQPDIVNCHSFYGAFPYKTLPELSNRYPVCLTVHDPRPIGTMETVCWSCDRNAYCLRCPMVQGRWRKVVANPYLKQRVKKRWWHSRCREDLRIVAPSQWLVNRLKQHELKRFNVSCIPNGIDLNRFRPLQPDRARFGLPAEGVVILHLAWHMGWQINERKGMRFLAEAFQEQIAPQFPDAVLAVAGERFAPNHPQVVSLGMVDQHDLPALLSSIDIFATPTLADNLPYTVIESMACGKCVVSSNVGGVPEQVIDGQTGSLVPPADSEALGKAIVSLIDTPQRMDAFGKAGQARATERFAMDTFVTNYENLFEEMAGRR